MVRAIDLPYPPRWINAYVAAKLAEYSDAGVTPEQQLIPIFATKPGNTDEIWKQLMDTSPQSAPLLIQYDRLIRFRPSPFYEIKREQLVYYLYSNNLNIINNAIIAISHLLDREDVAAQEINAWAASNISTILVPSESNSNVSENLTLTNNVFFHNVKAYQADEVRDLVDLASAKAAYVNKIIIEYDYHPTWTQQQQNLT